MFKTCSVSRFRLRYSASCVKHECVLGGRGENASAPKRELYVVLLSSLLLSSLVCVVLVQSCACGRVGGSAQAGLLAHDAGLRPRALRGRDVRAVLGRARPAAGARPVGPRRLHGGGALAHAGHAIRMPALRLLSRAHRVSGQTDWLRGPEDFVAECPRSAQDRHARRSETYAFVREATAPWAPRVARHPLPKRRG